MKNIIYNVLLISMCAVSTACAMQKDVEGDDMRKAESDPQMRFTVRELLDKGITVNQHIEGIMTLSVSCC